VKIVGFELEDWGKEVFNRLKEGHDILLTEQAISEGLAA
jgi:hypothetical protein